MKKIAILMSTLSLLMTGAMASSLLFTHTDNWKLYLVVALLCLTLHVKLKESE